MLERMIKWFEDNRRVSWGVIVVIMVFMFYISSLEFGSGAPGGGFNLAVVYHLIAYFGLGLFMAIAIVQGKYKNRIWLALLMTVLYGISDEVHQGFVPGRNMSFGDVFLDGLGALAACVFYLGIRWRDLK